jgi:TRAP transporter TAXI family solute receptor
MRALRKERNSAPEIRARKRLSPPFLGGLILLFSLAGCGSGPGGDALRKDVAGRLAQAVPAGTVTLAAFDRRGSQADTKAPPGETRRILYFDAELKLERDYDFGAWDSPGVAGIVSALGTGPRGIVGITSGGNKAGDVVRAHGTALYKREGSGWAPVVSGGYSPTAAPAYATSAPQGGPKGLLEALRKSIENVPKDTSPAARALIEQELAAAHATIRATLARAENGYAIAAGPEHGQYLRFAQALSDNKDSRVVALVTRGGEENLHMLRAGRVALALSQGDAALAAYEGTGNFAGDGPHLTLRALGSLYPEPVHVIVRADSPIASMADLAGRRVVVGPEGAASRTTALRVLEAHGLGPKNLGKVMDLGLGDALVALRGKEVDAVIQVIGAPADSVRDALTAIPLRLVPLSQRAITALVASKAGYFAYTIQHGAYSTQKQDVPTIATAAILLASTELSEIEIDALTRYVFGEQRDFAARGSAQGTQVSAANARLGLSVPLHVAAARALEKLAPTAAPAAAAGK